MKFFQRNLVIKILSLLSALLLWFYVTNEQAPAEVATRTVRLEVSNLRSDFTVVEKPETVQVKIQGPKNTLDNLNNKDISAYVDLTNARPGNNDVAVKVKVPGSVRSLGAIPEFVSINLDAMETKQVPVKVNMIGKPLAGYNVGDPKVNPSSVTIKGPGRYLKQINEVITEIEIEGAQQNLNISRPVKISVRNVDTSAIVISPSDVQVIISVAKDIQTKTLPLKYALKGDPATGFQVASVTMAIDNLNVQGTKELLATLSVIELEPIDITGANSDVTREVKIALPAGVTSQNVNTVTVSVKISAKPGDKVGQ